MHYYSYAHQLIRMLQPDFMRFQLYLCVIGGRILKMSLVNFQIHYGKLPSLQMTI